MPRRLEYLTGLQPSVWRRLPRVLVTPIAKALRDLLLERRFQPEARKLAMTCRTWRTVFSPLWWCCQYFTITSLSQLHKLEEIISSPLSGTAKDHIHQLRLELRWDNDDNDSSRFLSAWRSLSRRLHRVRLLQIGVLGRDSRLQLKSPSISLRPCPRPLLHIRDLQLAHVTFPTFSALFRDIGALPSLERLSLSYIQWSGACDPESSPPSSTATFGSIVCISASKCTDDGWPLIWIFTASSLRYRHPWRAPDDMEEARTRSVRADVRAIGQVFRWVLGRARTADNYAELSYIRCAPKGIR